ncbi:hypothetical protein BDZ45DRAFT_328966 [Acephala macrosclerotiorum]|nr:hypothetical protein BDZ45DRAFT_328966 [Acephala macrosclerotiorum]
MQDFCKHLAICGRIPQKGGKTTIGPKYQRLPNLVSSIALQTRINFPHIVTATTARLQLPPLPIIRFPARKEDVAGISALLFGISLSCRRHFEEVFSALVIGCVGSTMQSRGARATGPARQGGIDDEDLTKILLGILLSVASYAVFSLIDPKLESIEDFMNAATFYRERIDWVLNHATERNMLIIQSIGTCVALLWLLGRAWNVLWKPVNDLISILGVEVPDAPEVSLAGIKHNAITLHWSRPGPHKPVVKYLIQVNGVNGT